MSDISPRFVYDDRFLQYHFHDEHPFNQKRLLPTLDLVRHFRLLSKSQLMTPRQATEEELSLAHDHSYIDLIKKCSHTNYTEDDLAKAGLDSSDTPAFKGMHDAASLIVGGTLKAIEQVMRGKCDHAVNLAGGLHHALTDKAAGFCVYNDASVGIAWLKKHYPDVRILYIDTDAHHGDGVQWSFYDDPAVCTLSIHESGRYLFPGTGDYTERGDGQGYGFSINVPLDPYTEDESYLEALKTILPKVVKGVRPDIIISQHGCDAHHFDPLTHFSTSMRIFREIPKLIHHLAHDYCEGRWVALGGGGYDIWRVVPRAWTLLWAEMSDQPLDEQPLPKAWLHKWQPKSPVQLVETLSDPIETWKTVPRRAEITKKNQQTIKKILPHIPRYEDIE